MGVTIVIVPLLVSGQRKTIKITSIYGFLCYVDMLLKESLESSDYNRLKLMYRVKQ